MFCSEKNNMSNEDEKRNPPFDTKLYMKDISDLLDKKLGIVLEEVGEMSLKLKQVRVKVDRVESTQIEQSSWSQRAQKSCRSQPRERRAEFENYYRGSHVDEDNNINGSLPIGRMVVCLVEVEIGRMITWAE